jgi:hypothetical protein
MRSCEGELPRPKLRGGKDLRPWQSLGVTFLVKRGRKLGFALLGDEMGVGKVTLEPLHPLTVDR